MDAQIVEVVRSEARRAARREGAPDEMVETVTDDLVRRYSVLFPVTEASEKMYPEMIEAMARDEAPKILRDLLKTA